MKLSQLRDLVAVAQRGGLRRAARHLGLAQPVVSRSIRELEHELGTPLFERSTTGMVLTPVGAAFEKRCAAIQLELERACDEVRQLRGFATGKVSIGLSTAPHVSMLAQVLGNFGKRYPSVTLEILEGLFPEMESAILNGVLDFYVGPIWQGSLSRDFSVEKLFDNRRVIMGRMGSPYAGATSLREVADARWVATSVTASPDLELQPIFEELGLPQPFIAVRAHTAMSMIMATASTDMLTMVPQQWLDFARDTGRLMYIPVREELKAPPICVVHRSALPLTPAAEHLVDLFRRAALNRVESLRGFDKP